MKSEIENLKKDYGNYLLSKGYKQNSSVKITSGVDPSVVLIGSTISVLKPKLLNHEVSTEGEFLFQRAIRTRGIKRLLIPEEMEWYSYFDASGVLVNYDKLDKLVFDIIDFLNKFLNIDYCDIMIRVSGKDNDLMESLKNLDGRVVVEIDSREEKYYRHKYGLQEFGIYGRNLNIAIRGYKNSEYKDIGNIIIIESPNEKFGVECAIGVNAMLMRKFGLSNSIEASSIVDVYHPVDDSDYKFLDCLSVVSHLAYENAILINSRSPQYIYRKYLRALKYWAEIKKISNDELLDMIKMYIQVEYSKNEKQKIDTNVRRLLLQGGFRNGK